MVRRQGVATLRGVQGIVRLQALFRGRRVRVSDVGREVQKKCSTLVSHYPFHVILLSFAWFCVLVLRNGEIQNLDLDIEVGVDLPLDQAYNHFFILVFMLMFDISFE